MFENIYVIWIKNSIYFKWLLYTGKSENNNLSNIIYKLWMNYEGENYCLYINRYYTSINALINIKKYNIYAIGTILKKRIWKNDEISEDIKLLNKREYKFYNNKDQLQLTVWKDKKRCIYFNKISK
jgi:hypothetical protein